MYFNYIYSNICIFMEDEKLKVEFKQLNVKNIITVPCSYINSLKKVVNSKLQDSLYKWDPNVKGIMIKFSDLKIRKKLIEIVEEQDEFNIPVRYQAVYVIPREESFTYAEVTQITEKCIQLNILGFITGVVDLDRFSGEININHSQTTNKKFITILEKDKSKEIKEGDTILVKLHKCYVKINKSTIFECEVDLKNLTN